MKPLKRSWTCPNCLALKFDSQNKMVQHAISCKELKSE